MKYADLTPEQKAARNKANLKRQVRQQLIVQKAKAAGITVTEKEVDAAMAKKVK